MRWAALTTALALPTANALLGGPRSDAGDGAGFCNVLGGHHVFDQTMKRAAVLTLVGALLLLVVGPILLLAVAGGSRDGAVPSGDVPRDSPSTASATERDPSGVEAVGEGAWWRIGWRPLHDPGAPDWSTMTIGLLDGTILGEVALEGNAVIGGTGAPFVRGPQDGRIVYATQVAGRTELRVIDTSSGIDEVLVQTRARIMDAVMVGDGSVVYAADQGIAGIWRMPLDGADEPVRIAEPPEIGVRGVDAIVVAPIAGLPLGVSLRVSDEGRLAALICEAACVLRVIDLATGIELGHLELEPVQRTLTSFVGDTVVLDGRTAIDVVTGAALADVEPGVDAVLQNGDLGVELPDGWRLETEPIDPDNPMAFAVRFVAVGPAGARLPLDILGEVSTQG